MLDRIRGGLAFSRINIRDGRKSSAEATFFSPAWMTVKIFLAQLTTLSSLSWGALDPSTWRISLIAW